MSLDKFIIDESKIRDAYINRVMDKFAKMLAEENIYIIYGKFPTASIHLSKRIVYIPTWMDLDEDLKIRLRLHEISHAVHTPVESLHDLWSTTHVGKYSMDHLSRSEKRKFQRYVNIIEDNRIDRLSIRIFPGLKKYYHQANIKFQQLDFLKLNKFDNLQEAIDNFNFIDRLLLLNFEVPFKLTLKNDKEKSLYQRYITTFTFDDTWELSKDIYDYVTNEEVQFEPPQFDSMFNNPDDENGDAVADAKDDEDYWVVEGEDDSDESGEGEDDDADSQQPRQQAADGQPSKSKNKIYGDNGADDNDSLLDKNYRDSETDFIESSGDVDEDYRDVKVSILKDDNLEDTMIKRKTLKKYINYMDA